MGERIVLFLITVGEHKGFVAAADIGVAECYTREWLEGIGLVAAAPSTTMSGVTILRTHEHQVDIKPLLPLCDIRSLTGTPVDISIRTPAHRPERRHDEYLETL